MWSGERAQMVHAQGLAKWLPGRSSYVVPMVILGFLTIRAIKLTRERSPDPCSKIFMRVLIVLAANWALLVAAFSLDMMIEQYLLGFAFGNAGIVFGFYLVSKKLHKETIGLLVWLLLAGAVVSITAALYFFAILRTTDNAGSWEHSVSENEDCLLLGLDNHDIWHILSAIGCFLILLILWFIDQDVKNVPESELATFF